MVCLSVPPVYRADLLAASIGIFNTRLPKEPYIFHHCLGQENELALVVYVGEPQGRMLRARGAWENLSLLHITPTRR